MSRISPVLTISLLAVSTVFVLRSFGANPARVEAADGRLEASELEREATAVRATVVVARAAEAWTGVEHTIHRRDGAIVEKTSYGNDPEEIRG